MRDVQQYFDLLSATVDFSLTTSAELEFERRDFSRGVVEGVFYFADGSRLEFTERIVIESARPVKREYRYQYVRVGKTVFRYDNAAHHPKLSNFPHHKHVGRKVIAAIEPALNQVLDEVQTLLQAARNEPPVPPKRRRQRK